MIIFGHRGAAGYEFENTASSFRKAIQLDVDYIETDIHVIKSGHVVCIHDKKVSRVTNGKGHVAKKNLNEIKLLKKHNGDHILTLEELLDLVTSENKKYKRHVRLNLEIKGKNTAEPTVKIISKYISKKGWKADDFLITSFDYAQLKSIKKLLPEIRIGLLSIFLPFNYMKQAKAMQAYSLHPYKFFVRKWIVKNAHNQGLKIIPYTVNNLNDIARLKSIGVDGIISDFPDRVK